MSRWLKLLCIWCLVLVLPLQSLAAGCRLACVGPHAAAGAVLAETETASHPCHGTAAQAGSGLGAAGDDGAAGGEDHRCNACAGCCALVALPVGTLLIGSPAAMRDGKALSTWPQTSLVVAGLERLSRAIAR